MARLFDWLRGDGAEPKQRTETKPRARKVALAPLSTAELGSGWVVQLTALVRWLEAEGQMPSRTADDLDERRLAEWLRTQRRTPLSDARARVLEERVPGWRDRGRGDDRFRATVDRIQKRTAAGTTLERRDRAFLSRQRMKAREGTLSAGRRRMLDKARPGWEGPRRP